MGGPGAGPVVRGGACGAGRGLAAVVFRPRKAALSWGSRLAGETLFGDVRSRTEPGGPERRLRGQRSPSSAAAMSARCCAGQVSETGCRAGCQSRERAARRARVQETPWAGRDAGEAREATPPATSASGLRDSRLAGQA